KSSSFDVGYFRRRFVDLYERFIVIFDYSLEYSAGISVFCKLIIFLKDKFSEDICSEIHNLTFDDLCYMYFMIKDFSKDVVYDSKVFKLQESCNKNSLNLYIDSLTKHYSKLLFVRVDVAINVDYQSQTCIKVFNGYIRTLLNRIHNKDTCFKDLHGYAWAIEHGRKKGYHCHLLLIYDGHKHQKDFRLACMIGKCWKDITANQGCFFTSNTPVYKKRLEQQGKLGIGMIHRNNPKQVLNAINAAMYLVNPEKEDQYLRTKVKGMRTFGRGLYNKSIRRNCIY
ncbi:MAG: inovirus-type Gp2 protein, partial [Proteobacteria bacterium]|nr:inovirus-type Gp2 protein [Pseudomonadota bacterium]